MDEAVRDPIIEARRVTKFFGTRPALKGVTFQLAAGRFLGVFGPNGAGKTTLLKILSTLAKPSSGSIVVGGYDLSEDAVEVRRQIGLVSHQTLLYDDLTAEENLKFFGRMYDVPRLEARIKDVLTAVGLLHRRHDRVRTFSRGMQQRLAIARAILHDPPLLLLDEPDTGLDQQAGGILEALLLDTVAGVPSGPRTVVMTTHNLERGFQMCDRLVFLVNGTVAHEADKGNLSFGDFRQIYSRYTS
ncbi:MAG: heme ABC exporter ATP-binding protein CcmA [Chloroflexi bacterium]|nr:heme ABC exporter ATP-binding protein CcmA [Chloroflexota bacterium]